MKVLLIEKRASRGYVDQRLEALEETVSQSLTRMEQAVVNCMLRRDEKWRRELSKLKVTSTPQTPRTVPRWSLDVSDIPRGSSSVSQSAYAKPLSALCFHVLEKTEMQRRSSTSWSNVKTFCLLGPYLTENL